MNGNMARTMTADSTNRFPTAFYPYMPILRLIGRFAFEKL